MSTNQQTQSNNTTGAQNRFVSFSQGGALSRTYRNYIFELLFEDGIYNREVVKECADIGKELITILSKDKVVYFGSHWKKRNWQNVIFGEDGHRLFLLKMAECLC